MGSKFLPIANLFTFQVEDQSASSTCHITKMHHAFFDLRMHFKLAFL